ncbi:MAG: Mu transposase C-terminal domain-containing protein [Campylobacteraceae bacterium]
MDTKFFQINKVFQTSDNTYRILITLSDSIVWIDINNLNALPEIVTNDYINELLKNNELLQIEDPYNFLLFINVEPNTIYQTKRDENYKLIEEIVNNENFYSTTTRGTLISKIIKERGSTKQTIYRLLRKYWQQGQHINTLLPGYYNSGGKGKAKKTTDKKIGRPRIYGENSSLNNTLKEDSKKLMRITINRYLFKQHQSIEYTYRRFLAMFKKQYQNIVNADIPTIWQFKYLYKKEYSPQEKIKKRATSIEFNKDLRELKSTATQRSFGSGSCYEIDSTIGDIYLVSDKNQNIVVGRPIIYLVIDTFSRLITGFYVGFENASYATAAQALWISFSNKISLCKEYGFDISNDTWPSIGLPQAIRADRAELLGHQIESLEKKFSIRIENSPAYRGDAKGIVERYIQTVQNKAINNATPGKVETIKEKKRGGGSTKNEATLNITQFTKIIIGIILRNNLYAVLEKYDRPPDMPNDIASTPINIWNWGIKNRTGKLRTADENAIKVALLPREKATISNLGFKVFGIYYNCAEASKKGWFFRAKNTNRPKSLMVSFNPYNLNSIYIYPDDTINQNFWIGEISQRSTEYKDLTIWDVTKKQKEIKDANTKAKFKSLLSEVDIEEKILTIFKDAKKISPTISKPVKNKKIDMKKYREIEKGAERTKTKDMVLNITSNSKKHTDKEILQEDKEHEETSFPKFSETLFPENKNE